MRLNMGGGVACWAQANNEGGAIDNFIPAFTGKTQVLMRLEWRKALTSNGLSGGFCGSLVASDASASINRIFFEAPNFAEYEHAPETKAPHVAQVQLTGFVDELVVSDHVYDTSTLFAQALMNVHTLVPMKLYDPHTGGFVDDPAPQVHVTGSVISAQRMTNPSTYAQFWWLVVRIAGGAIDIVADLHALKAAPAVGARIDCRCWLTGRIL